MITKKDVLTLVNKIDENAKDMYDKYAPFMGRDVRTLLKFAMLYILEQEHPDNETELCVATDKLLGKCNALRNYAVDSGDEDLMFACRKCNTWISASSLIAATVDLRSYMHKITQS